MQSTFEGCARELLGMMGIPMFETSRDAYKLNVDERFDIDCFGTDDGNRAWYRRCRPVRRMRSR